MMRILVVMVTYNGVRWLETGLRALRLCGMPLDLYVYDNASSDGSADAVAALWPEAVLVRGKENVGFAAANNAGFRYALEHGYDAVYLLNQDAWPLPGAMSALADAHARHPEFALLSPLQLQRCGKAEGVCPQKDSLASLVRPLPTFPASSPCENLSPSGPDPCPCPGVDTPFGDTPPPSDLPQRMDPQFEKNVWRKAGEERDGIREVRRVMAAHWLVSRKAIETVGLFEEMLPLYGQDDNWCDRARYHGLKIGIVPSAEAVHDRAKRKEPKERIIYRNYYMGSLVRLLDPNRPLWERWLFVSLFTLVKTVKYGSLKPLRYYFKNLLPARKDIRAARAETRQTL